MLLIIVMIAFMIAVLAKRYDGESGDMKFLQTPAIAFAGIRDKGVKARNLPPPQSKKFHNFLLIQY